MKNNLNRIINIMDNIYERISEFEEMPIGTYRIKM